jgi:hypothetical protein
MRIVVGLLALLCVGGFLARHRSGSSPEKAPAIAQAAKAAAPAPAPSVSEHNFPKQALDRAHDVKRQVLEQRKSNGTN